MAREITSSDAYANSAGSKCPVCGSSEISTDSPEVTDSIITVEVYCNNPECECNWTDVYELTGYDNLIDKNGDKIDKNGNIVKPD